MASPTEIDGVSRATVTVVTRGITIRIVAVLANLVLARLMTPSTFGLAAIWIAVFNLGSFLMGLGTLASLIRGAQPPSVDDMEALFGFQLATSIAFACAVVGVVILIGPGAYPLGVMFVGLPLLAPRTGPSAWLSNQLRFREQTTTAMIETVVYYSWATATVAAGWGLWGIATAMPARAIAGTAAFACLSPVRVPRPRLDVDFVRRHIGFGVRFQAPTLVGLLRDQAINGTAAVIGGLRGVGMWAVTQRTLQPMTTAFAALMQAAFPAAARHSSAGQRSDASIRRALAVTSVAMGTPLALVAAAGPIAVPLLLGEVWHEAGLMVPIAALALYVNGTLSTITSSVLFADNRPTVVLAAECLYTVAWLAVSALASYWLEARAIPVGWLFGAILQGGFLLSRVDELRVRGFILFAAPCALAGLASMTGLAAGGLMGHRAAGAVVASVVGLGTYALGIRLLLREVFFDTLQIARRGFRRRVGTIEESARDRPE